MSGSPEAAASALPASGQGGIRRPKLTEVLVILGVVVVTVCALVLVDHQLGPKVRPAQTPSGWVPIYGDGFALSLPASWDVTTKQTDLTEVGIPNAVMVAGDDGSDPNLPDAFAAVVSEPGTAASLATSIGGLGAGTQATLPAGDATTFGFAGSGMSARAWLLDDQGVAWGIVVFVRTGSSYSLDDVATDIANSLDIS